MLPAIIKDFTARIDGLDYAGVIESATLPNLQHDMMEYQGLGMRGKVKLYKSMQLMELEFELKEWNRYVIGKLGECDISGTQLTLIGAAQTQDGTCKTEQHQLICHGRWESLNYGEAKAGEAANLKVKMPLTRFEHLIDGTQVLLVDMLNATQNSGGTNPYAKIAQALNQ